MYFCHPHAAAACLEVSIWKNEARGARMRKRAQRSHYSAPTISHGEQCSVEGENGLAGKIRQYMVESYKEMHKETPTDKVEGPRQRCFRLSVHPSPSVSYIHYPSIILHYSFRQPWCRCCYLPWRLIAKQSSGGLIMDKGCHVIDRIDYLFGPHP